jgi:hypothetical protein
MAFLCLRWGVSILGFCSLGFFSSLQLSQYSDLKVKIALHLRHGLGKILNPYPNLFP